MKTVILVPRRGDNGWRDRVWAFCRSRWEQEFPDAPIFEGDHLDGPFNRSAATNRAAEAAGDWEMAIIVDADCWTDPATTRKAISLAASTGSLVQPFTIRRDLNRRGTEAILAGHQGSWNRFLERTQNDNLSSVLVVPRALWDAIGGYDEKYVGWGYEDNSFHLMCDVFGGSRRLPGDCWHLWHPQARQTQENWEELRLANRSRHLNLVAAKPNKQRMLALYRGTPYSVEPFPEARIPAILHRTVPATTSPEVESWWQAFADLHPGWTLMTHRDPLDPADWPLTSPYWPLCDTGARLADLIRLEALLRWGGFYVDSDCEPYLPLDPLRPLLAVAAWEDEKVIPQAVVGAVPGHPAIREALDLAIERIKAGQPTWESGPGVTTQVFRGRRDVLLLPPGAFYPYHYKRKQDRKRDHRAEQPWAFMAHHWAGSWLPKNGQK